MKKSVQKLFVYILIFCLTFTEGQKLVYGIQLPSIPSLPTMPSVPTMPAMPKMPEVPTLPTNPANPITTPTTEPQPTSLPITPTIPPLPQETQGILGSPTATPTNPPSQTNESGQTGEALQPLQNNSSQTTGGTTSDGNMGDVKTETGDATSTSFTITEGNENTAETESDNIGIQDLSDTSLINSGNGADSQNDIILDSESTDTIIQDNFIVLNNSVYQSATTGNNSSSKNTGGDVEIKTGDANTSGTLVTAVNTNADAIMISEFAIAEDYYGDYILDFDDNCVSGCSDGLTQASNIGNGSNSTNNIDIYSSNNDMTFQNNDAFIGNTMILEVDSGNNTADKNTGGNVSIETGNSNIAANVATFANNNIEGNVVLGVVNIYGDLVGDIIFPEEYCAENTASDTNLANTNNGSGSTNTIDATLVNNEEIFQINAADITNIIQIDATTGSNNANKNTSGDISIETGNVNVSAEVVNIANTNLIGQDMWVVLINEAGKWIGSILGSPSGTNYGGSSGTDFAVDDNGEVYITNNGNGSDSVNNISYTQTANSTVVQNNNSLITNNVMLDANTGGNSADKNTGGDVSVKSGDVNVVANVVNFVNNNIIGSGRLFVTVINVFGSWIGDFVGPGMSKAKADDTQAEGDSYPQENGNPQQDQNPSIGGADIALDNTEENNQENDANTESEEEAQTSIPLGSSTTSGGSSQGTSQGTVSQGNNTGAVGTTTVQQKNNSGLSYIFLQGGDTYGKFMHSSNLANAIRIKDVKKGAVKNKIQINLAWLIWLVLFIFPWIALIKKQKRMLRVHT